MCYWKVYKVTPVCVLSLPALLHFQRTKQLIKATALNYSAMYYSQHALALTRCYLVTQEGSTRPNITLLALICVQLTITALIPTIWLCCWIWHLVVCYTGSCVKIANSQLRTSPSNIYAEDGGSGFFRNYRASYPKILILDIYCRQSLRSRIMENVLTFLHSACLS